MADAVYYQLLDSTLFTLKSDLRFSAQGSDPCGAINPDAIVLRKLSTRERLFESGQKNEQTPGILVSLARRVIRPPTWGTNIRDDVVYPVLCQIIDRDSHGRGTLNLRSYLKWQEQIAKAFNNKGRPDVMNDEGKVDICHVRQTESINERLWIKHQLFVGAVELYFLSREPRGIT